MTRGRPCNIHNTAYIQSETHSMKENMKRLQTPSIHVIIHNNYLCLHIKIGVFVVASHKIFFFLVFSPKFSHSQTQLYVKAARPFLKMIFFILRIHLIT